MQTDLIYDSTANFVHFTYKFTGKERDAESGNDCFGTTYYASTMGRFLSPDWSAQATPVPYATMNDSQSLNLYGYMRNNPLGGADPDGHCDIGCQVSTALGIWQGIQRDGGVGRAGSKLEKLIFTPPVLTWPEYGP